MELEPPKRGLYLRTLVCELERVHSHLLWLGVAGHEVGFDSFFMYTWRDREVVMDILEMISGNRVHYAINTIGGVRRDIDEEPEARRSSRCMAPLKKRTEYYPTSATHEPTFVARIAGVGMLRQGSRPSTCAPSGRSPAPRASTWTSARTTPTPSTRARVQGHHRRRAATSSAGSWSASRSCVESYKMIEQMLEQPARGRHRRQGPARVPAGRGHQPLRGAARRGHPLHQRQRHGQAGAGQGARPHPGQLSRPRVEMLRRLHRRHPDRLRRHRPLHLLHRPHR